MKKFKPFVLCMSCLCVRPFTAARHNAMEACQCGSEFCGCSMCAESAVDLLLGERNCDLLGLKPGPDLCSWNPEKGSEAGDMPEPWQWLADVVEQDDNLMQETVEEFIAACKENNIEINWGPRCTAVML